MVNRKAAEDKYFLNTGAVVFFLLEHNFILSLKTDPTTDDHTGVHFDVNDKDVAVNGESSIR